MNKPELLKYVLQAKMLQNECADVELAKLAVQIRIASAAESLCRDIHALRVLAEKTEKADK